MNLPHLSDVGDDDAFTDAGSLQSARHGRLGARVASVQAGVQEHVGEVAAIIAFEVRWVVDGLRQPTRAQLNVG